MSSPFQIQRRIAAFIEKKQNEVDENNRQEFCSVFQSMEGQFTKLYLIEMLLQTEQIQIRPAA